jgi:uncharacterized Zn finger protein (UPF0148 family)
VNQACPYATCGFHDFRIRSGAPYRQPCPRCGEPVQVRLIHREEQRQRRDERRQQARLAVHREQQRRNAELLEWWRQRCTALPAST